MKLDLFRRKKKLFLVFRNIGEAQIGDKIEMVHSRIDKGTKGKIIGIFPIMGDFRYQIKFKNGIGFIQRKDFIIIG